jgi:hypothetical protein
MLKKKCSQEVTIPTKNKKIEEVENKKSKIYAVTLLDIVPVDVSATELPDFV